MSVTTLRHGFLLHFVALAAAVTGCGGGSSPPASRTRPENLSTPSTRPLTKAAYIDRLDAICQRSSRRLDAVNSTLERISRNAPDDNQALEMLRGPLRTGYELTKADLARARAVPVPPSERKPAGALLEAWDEQTALLGRVVAAADSGDSERFVTLVDETKAVKNRAHGIAQGFGMRKCGKD